MGGKSVPNFQAIGPNLGSLEGRKEKHKTGSCGKLDLHFSLKFYGGLQAARPAILGKFKKNRIRKFLSKPF